MIQRKLSRYTCVFFLLHCDNRSLTSIFSRSVQFFCISVHHDEDDNNQNSASNKPLAKLYKVLNNQGQKLVPNHTITDLITG